MTIIKIILTLLLALPQIRALAGSTEGPFVIWLNLSSNQSIDIDNQVKTHLNSGDELCWNSEARMYMKKIPKSITSAIAKSALIGNTKRAKNKMISTLTQPYDDIPGFDGVIAYIDSPRPIFKSLSRNGILKSEPIDNPNDKESIIASLCIVMPRTFRKP